MAFVLSVDNLPAHVVCRPSLAVFHQVTLNIWGDRVHPNYHNAQLRILIMPVQHFSYY